MNQTNEDKTERQLIFEAETDNKPTLPESEWVSEWDYCCYPFYRYRNKNKENIYSKYTRYKHLLGIYYPFYPIFIFSVITVIYFHKYLIPFVDVPKFLPYYFMFFYTLAAISYFIVHFMNPGILPFTWSLTRRKSYSPNELKSGTAITPSQIEFARNSERPPRAIFTKKYGYYVLRADHECGVVNTWIGLNNHRYFLIAIFSGTVYAASYSLFMIYYFFQSEIRGYKIIFFAIFILITLYGFHHINQVRAQIINITKNNLNVELMKGLWETEESPYRKDCLSNWEEVCGSRKYFLCWWLPVPIPKVVDGFDYEPYQKLKYNLSALL